jgi:glucokinase
MSYLIGDIGGTHTRLAISVRDKILHKTVFDTKHIRSLEKTVLNFLKQTNVKPTNACFAVAGPVSAGIVKAPNIPWKISQKSLQTKLRVPIKLMNDVAAFCYGLKMKNNSLAIVPGTGLGVAFKTKKIIPSEAGHSLYSPQNEEEILIWRFLKKKYGRVSNERIASGKGITDVYYYLTGKKRTAEQIVCGKDKKSKHALRIFVSALGSITGDLVLTFNAFNVYVGGSLAKATITQNMKSFKQAMKNKGRMSSLMKIRIQIVQDENTVLRGTIKYLNS